MRSEEGCQDMIRHTAADSHLTTNPDDQSDGTSRLAIRVSTRSTAGWQLSEMRLAGVRALPILGLSDRRSGTTSSTPKNVWVKRFLVWLILVVVFDATSFVAFRATMSPSPALTMEDQTRLAEASMEPILTPCKLAVTKYVEDGSPNSPNAAELHSIQEALCRTPQDDETPSELTREFR